ncbi:hypothetical protein GGP41_008056 [Bipolaris sorokiniana]|uniref:Uncharacterized protein n=2 Tax=Cochliobolus sativus TaxID=45130 RepID=A0A8H5ZQW3_COCSA|nr:uncharacterized protein COCSADRAFT_158731 [Bipolaris sorokiniana ND90Pr]EMD66643.1 hypothetical protein COCSADRAFT_158731 [Bipolaris sorokiniana ND90Pr]KAF5852619.1 hypothetical protein GGP41_008056 [Bipolaris sorokiniana]
MEPHFLNLPPEIRNLIYEYALAQNHGLCYKWSNCAYRLRIRNEEFEKIEEEENDDEDEMGHCWEEDDEMDVDEREYFEWKYFESIADENSSLTKKDSINQSRFQSDGYGQDKNGYTLAHSKLDMEALTDGGDYEVKEKMTVPQILLVNQLQLVCRRLYSETKGLELRYNTVFFAGDKYNIEPFYQRYARFLRRPLAY